jgi:hypothetical protein
MMITFTFIRILKVVVKVAIIDNVQGFLQNINQWLMRMLLIPWRRRGEDDPSSEWKRLHCCV